MKGKDYGTNNTSTKEKFNGSISPKEIEAQLELISKNNIDIPCHSENTEKDSKNKTPDKINNRIKQPTEKQNTRENKIIKNGLNIKFDNNIKNNFKKNGCNQLNIKNCINKIDLDKNIIILNKQNLKELNIINKEIVSEKKNEKAEIIDFYINDNYDKDVNNSVKSNYEYLLDDFSCLFDNFDQIKFNSKFPNEIIENFFEKKRNKNKEKNNYNYTISFGNNPLEKIKDIQNSLIEPPPPPKNIKITNKQFKINQKNLKEQNILLQKYIKSFPVLNCPESKIFKLNQYYYFNKINDDKNINNFNNFFNNDFNKNIKNNFNNKIKQESDEINKNKDKEESEEETINRHIKKKFLSKKRIKSKNKI